MRNPILILIRGLPGSGKSTLAQKIKSRSSDVIHIEADMYFINDQGEYIFDPSRLSSAHNWCKTCVEDYLLGEKSVIVSNTFTTMKEMKPYLDLSSSLDIPVYVFRMIKEYGSIHDVPKETIQRMKDRFEDYEFDIIYNNLTEIMLEKGV